MNNNIFKRKMDAGFKVTRSDYPVNLQYCKDSNLEDYSIVGNTTITGTPSPSSPATITNVGDLSGSNYIIPIQSKGYSQLVENGNFSSTDGWGFTSVGSAIASNNVVTITYGTEQSYGCQCYRNFNFIKNHKYYVCSSAMISVSPYSDNSKIDIRCNGFSGNQYFNIIPINGNINTWYSADGIGTAANSGSYEFNTQTHAYGSYYTDGVVLSVKNCMCFDLTEMYGEGNEPATVEEFRKDYPSSYYPYNAGTNTYNITLSKPLCKLDNNFDKYTKSTLYRSIDQIDLGSLEWEVKSNNCFSARYTSAVGQKTDTGVATASCSIYTVANTYSIAFGEIDKAIGISTAEDDIWIRDTSYSTVEEITAYLQGKTLYALLKTPTIETITNKVNVNTVSGRNTISCNASLQPYCMTAKVKDSYDIVDNKIVNALYGKTLVWNNLANVSNVTLGGGLSNLTVSDGVAHADVNSTADNKDFRRYESILANHKVYFKGDFRSDTATSANFMVDDTVFGEATITSGTWQTLSAITTISTATTTIKYNFEPTTLSSGYAEVRNIACIDLTKMFGSGNEPTSLTDDKILWINEMLSENNGYNTGELKSTNPQSLTSFNNTYNYPYNKDDVIGELKSAGTAFDERDYENGMYIKRIGEVDLGTLTWEYLDSESFATIPRIPLTDANTPITNGICSKYEIFNTTSLASTKDKTVNLGHNYYQIIIKDSDYTTAEAFKTAMSGVKLYYELSTPIYTPIPNINQSKFYSNGTYTFTQTSGIKPPVQYTISHTSDSNVDSLDSLRGKSLVWNQLVNGAGTITLENSKKYLTSISGTESIVTGDGSGISVSATDMVFNLTKMFGAGSEPSTVAEFKAMFPETYYSYNAGDLISTQPIKLTSNNVDMNINSLTYFSNCMKSAGTVYDEIDYVKGIAIQRMGIVDLGTLDWEYLLSYTNPIFSTNRPSYIKALSNSSFISTIYTFSTTDLNNIKNMSVAIGNAKLSIRNGSYTTAESFKTAMSGVYLIYELATPIITPLSQLPRSTFYSDGTNTWTQTSGIHPPVESSISDWENSEHSPII